MAEIVLRVRLTSGDQVDVVHEDEGAADDDEIVVRVVAALAHDGGFLRCRHGDRLMVVYARGVAAIEVAPRGAVL